jgi:hypothetical protein
VVIVIIITAKSGAGKNRINTLATLAAKMFILDLISIRQAFFTAMVTAVFNKSSRFWHSFKF